MRRDILEAIQNDYTRDQILHNSLAALEDMRQNLDPQMNDWIPTGANYNSITPDELQKIDLRKLRADSRVAYYKNPFGKNIIRTLIKFTIGSGIMIDFNEKNEEVLGQINEFWKETKKRLKWKRWCREYARRLFRDGETIVRRYEPGEQDPLQIRYVEPDLIADDDIKTDENDQGTVISYKIGDKDIKPENIHFMKADVDQNVPRGRPILEPLLPYLQKYGRWLDARMVLNIVRASVTVVQEVQGTSADVLRLGRKNQPTRNPGNQDQRTKMIRPGTIIRGTPGIKYNMLSPNLDARDAAEDGRTILLAVAAGAGFPDVYVTSDYCHSMETQALTERGWLDYLDIKAGDKLATMNPETGALEFQEPSELINFRYQGEMYNFNGRRYAFSVTSKHDLFVSSYHRKKHHESVRLHDRPLSEYSKIQAQNLEKSLYVVPSSVWWEGKDEPLYTLPDGTSVEMDLWLEFLGYVLTEGCITKGARGFVQITQKTADKIPIIQQCLDQLPWHYTTTISNGAHVFRIWNNDLHLFLNALIGTPEGSYSHMKHLPDFIWSLSPKYLKCLLDAMILGDGGYDNREGRTCKVFRTTSKRMADETQRLGIYLGYATTLCPSKNCDPICYYVGLSDGHPQLLETKKIEKTTVNRDVWCATVPNGLLITRLNGKPFISGNSGANFASTVTAQNPAIKEFEDWQEMIAEGITEIIEWFLDDAVERGFLPAMVDGRPIDTSFTIGFPPLLKRDVAQENSAYATMHENKALSLRTWCMKMGVDYDQEKKHMEDEPEVTMGTKTTEPKKGPEDRSPRQGNVGKRTQQQTQVLSHIEDDSEE